jgi:flavin reductase (DIM6/NTAB) family NADH-FMN oxidoreductase RutF
LGEIYGRLSGGAGPDDDVENDQELQADARGARWLRRHVSAPVAVITTRVASGFRGATVNAWMLTSIDPPLLAVSIELDSQMDGWLEESGCFLLNLLPWNQQFLADQFAGFAPLAPPTLRGIDHVFGVTGAPALSAAIAWADCVVVRTFETGDHRLFVGEIKALDRGRGQEDDPLLYYLNRYRRLD